MFGPRAGRVGAEAGRMFREITGFGAYKIQKNTIMSGTDRLPTFRSMQYGTRVQHREFLFDVITSPTAGAFKIQTIPIQPALLAAFPWLSASAEQYQEYQMNGVVYEFKSNSYDALASTNTASGTVVMATNYNVLDAPFYNKFQMEQTQYTCSDKPSNPLIHPIECAKIETPTSVLWTRPGPVSTGDLRLYDWANFSIATVGMQGTSVNIGELWVTYDITLLKPKLTNTVDVQDHYVLPVPYAVPGGIAYFGSDTHPPALTGDSDMGTTLSAFSSGNLDTINWPPGYTGKVVIIYRMHVTSVISASLATPYTINYSGGASSLTTFSDGTSRNEGPVGSPLVYNGNGGCTLVVFSNIVNGGSVRLTGGTTSATPTAGDLIICALPSNFDTLPAALSSVSTRHDIRPPSERKHRHSDVECEDDEHVLTPRSKQDLYFSVSRPVSVADKRKSASLK